MSRNLFRRLTFQTTDVFSPSGRLDNGESTSKMAKSLFNLLKMYSIDKSPERVSDVLHRIDVIWENLFNIEREVAPKTKFELAEELLIRPDIMKWLLSLFRFVAYEHKRKIRDIVNFTIIWGSNESEESSFARTKANKARFNVKIRDQLYHVKNEVIEMLAEGFDEPRSIGFYNDIIKLFIQDDVCLMAILDDLGIDETGISVRPHGAFWTIFERLSFTGISDLLNQQFDVTVANMHILESIIKSHNSVIRSFLSNNWDKFTCMTNKLMVSTNFYIQIKIMKILYNLLTSAQNFELMKQWFDESEHFRIVTINMQSKKREVRSAAIILFEVFIFNPEPNQKVKSFVSSNINVLIQYFSEFAPVHMYQGNSIEQEDSRYAKILHKLLNWNIPQPMTPEVMKELRESEELQRKMYEEMTIISRDYGEDNGPKVCHEYNINMPAYYEHLREPMVFGKPDM